MLSAAPALLTPKSETASSAAETSAILIFIHHPPSDSDRQFVIVILWLTENHMPAALSCQSLHSNRCTQIDQEPNLESSCHSLGATEASSVDGRWDGVEPVQRRDAAFVGVSSPVFVRTRRRRIGSRTYRALIIASRIRFDTPACLSRRTSSASRRNAGRERAIIASTVASSTPAATSRTTSSLESTGAGCASSDMENRIGGDA